MLAGWRRLRVDQGHDAVPLPVEAQAGGKAIASAATPLEVLVVDDNTINVTLMSKMIARLGHNPSQASNGLEAVAVASGKCYDIILMDVSMPVMDGREATGLIRAGGASAATIIIGVTAFSDEARLNDLTAAGMDAVVTKPINTAELSGVIARMLASRPIPQAGAAPAADTPSDLHRAMAQLEEMLDRSSALRFLDQALADVDKTLPVLRDKTMTLEDVADRIHSTVGSTAVVGLTQLSRLLAEAENAARAGDRAALRKLAPRIARHLVADQKSLRRARATAAA
ncbi:MAG: response regulator [Paracoccaceae bacterium]|nr:response regulator [Paracoccaceae bacterium]